LTTLSLSLHLFQMVRGEDVVWNGTYKALSKQLARYETSPSSSGMLVKTISANVSELLPMFNDKQKLALATMVDYFSLDASKPPAEVIQFAELEVVANATPAAAAKAVAEHAKECLQMLINFFSDNMSPRGVEVSPGVIGYTAGGGTAAQALAQAVAQDPARKRKAYEELAAAERPEGENTAAINAQANAAQTRLRQAQPFEGEVHARRGAYFPLTRAFGRVRTRRCSGFGFEKRPAPCPALLVFGKGRTCQTRPVGTNRPCACWERRSSSTEGVLHDGDTSCPSRRMLDTAGWRVRVLETKEFQCGGEGF
jgi:hypothetical protein